MAQQRPLLIPWLRRQIDSGRYPGVVWTNEERTEFSIPWKHALRQDSSSDDVLIFKAWAEVSGNGRAQGEASIWKRNFRSALRAKHFTLKVDNKNDNANPSKVYRWPDEARSGEACSSSGSQDQEEADFYDDISFPTQGSQVVPGFEDNIYLAEETLFGGNQHEYCPTGSTINHDILQECLKGLKIEPPTECIPKFEPTAEPQHQPIQDVTGGHALPEGQQYPVAFAGAAGGGVLPEQPVYPMDGAVGGACDPQIVEEFMNTVSRTIDGDHFKTQFNVSVYYRGVKVSQQLVQNEAGLRIVYRPDLAGPVIDPESGLTLVSLPSHGITMPDKTQADLTKRILDNLGEGLEVGVSGPVVYGRRRGESKVFWSFCKFDQSKVPQEVSKLEPKPLYLFKDFLQGISEFISGKECPPCSLFFFLGEKWPDPHNRPWEKKLIMVEVVLTSLDLLKSLAVEGGASSLQSVELQISLQEWMDICTEGTYLSSLNCL